MYPFLNYYFPIFRSIIFQRFIDALLSNQYNIQWDIHNLAMYIKCDVCNIPYDIIGKQETANVVRVASSSVE
jgi:hypothetical protein